jgi:hypothetical protein
VNAIEEVLEQNAAEQGKREEKVRLAAPFDLGSSVKARSQRIRNAGLLKSGFGMRFCAAAFINLVAFLAGKNQSLLILPGHGRDHDGGQLD